MTTYELPPEPPIGSRVEDVTGSVWQAHNHEWHRDGGSIWRAWPALLMDHGPLTLIEPDPWPTAPLIVATMADEHRTLLMRVNDDTTYENTTRVAERGVHTLTNVVPVTIVPAAALPVLWSALEQWLNNGVATATEDMRRLVGAVESLRGQIDALGVDL